MQICSNFNSIYNLYAKYWGTIMKNVAILGGGASGLMCALNTDPEFKVTLFEKCGKLGKKILKTGNGRCNITNKYTSNHSYNTDISNFLSRFSPSITLDFFKSIGLCTYFDEEGRCYPISNMAESVLSVLVGEVKRRNNIVCEVGAKFVDIEKVDNGYNLIFEDGKKLFFDIVVVALGNEIALDVFKKLDIRVKDFLPSLCSLKADTNKNLNGIRVRDVCVSCDDADFNECGEILFKDGGISGIVIFNLSAHLNWKNIKKTTIFIDFLPKISKNDLIIELKERKERLNSCSCSEFLIGMFAGALGDVLLSGAKIDFGKKVKDLNDEDIMRIVNQIKEFKLNVCGFEPNNQVCSGGVSLNGLDKNLQCKNHKGLYFIGEAVDVDGVCGGYNLQWAWTSGYVAGKSIK